MINDNVSLSFLIGKNIFNYVWVQTISGPIDDIAYKYLLETMLVVNDINGFETSSWLKSGEEMAKIFVRSGESEWLLKFKSGERNFQPRAGPADVK